MLRDRNLTKAPNVLCIVQTCRGSYDIGGNVQGPHTYHAMSMIYYCDLSCRRFREKVTGYFPFEQASSGKLIRRFSSFRKTAQTDPARLFGYCSISKLVQFSQLDCLEHFHRALIALGLFEFSYSV